MTFLDVLAGSIVRRGIGFVVMSENRTTETGCAQIVERNLPAIAELCRRFGVRRLDLFGSAATGRFDPARSDLDFLVEFKPDNVSNYADAYFGLLEQLEALFGRSVDLLTLPSLKNPYLRKQVLEERRILFRSDGHANAGRRSRQG